ncbi:MAG: DUF2332 family protein [Rhodovibrionaceae bacterium]|nr:DUF2332 family protein [Rhodovibrionaceae bacterium]
MLPEALRKAFLDQADACEALGSPFTARLCRLFAAEEIGDTGVRAALANWRGHEPGPQGDSVPLRLAGALHALVLENRDAALAAVYPPHHDASDDATLWSAIDAAVAANSERVLQWLNQPPQTNEVQRSAALLPGFLWLARRFRLPFVLSEIGASAGLNLFWERYGYRLGADFWGEPNSPVQLAPEWQGPTPGRADVKIMDRRGCDLSPLNAGRAADRVRLLSYVWADQRERVRRIRAALDIVAAAGGPPVDTADAVSWLEARLNTSSRDAVHVIYHSIAWQYLAEEAQSRGRDLIAEAGRRARDDAPLAWLSMKADGRQPGAAVTLQFWPGGETLTVARADFHGRWVTAADALAGS